MKYRKLGRTGLEVSEIAHGLWGMSGWSGSEDRESLRAMQSGRRSRLQFFRYRLGLRRWKKRSLAGADPGRKQREAPIGRIQDSADELEMARLSAGPIRRGLPRRARS